MERDRIHVKLSQRGIRCKRCREFGHLTIDCLRQIIRCWLCGEVGHQEPRCPHKICTSCGRKCNFFTNNCGYCRRFAHRKCNICGIRGHTHEMCPDLWRRYHLTVSCIRFNVPFLYVYSKIQIFRRNPAKLSDLRLVLKC